MAQDWNFTTVNQPGMNGRSIPYPRGHVLGGSTCISKSSFNDISCFECSLCMVDYMAYTRGSKDDLDRWARVTGDDGWSWDSLYPYMLKVSAWAFIICCLPFSFIMALLDGNTYSTPQQSEYSRGNRSECAWDFRYVSLYNAI